MHKHNYSRVHNSQTFDDTHTYWRERCECGKELLKTRKLPKRSVKPMKQTKLKPMSESKQAFAKVYAAMKKAYPEPCKCAVCKCILRKEMVSWHHPRGRIKARLLCFVPLCQRCHDRIHDNGRIARDFGYIQPEFDGRKADANTPNPFNLSPE